MFDIDEISPIIGNNSEENTIKKAIKKLSKDSKEIKVATGYFFISGFNVIQDELSNLRVPKIEGQFFDSPFKIIMGPQTDITTRDQLVLGYKKELEEYKKSLIHHVVTGKVDVR